jgi:hypothetical protein
MAGNVLFPNQQASQQGPYRAANYGQAPPDQLQFYSSNYSQYGIFPPAVLQVDMKKDIQSSQRSSMQGIRSGRSTPLAGYPDHLRMEGQMGWLAAFGTSGYSDGISSKITYF